MKWFRSDTLDLMELYEKYERLWNICSKDYENKLMREAVYENIRSKFRYCQFGTLKKCCKVRQILPVIKQFNVTFKLMRAGMESRRTIFRCHS